MAVIACNMKPRCRLRRRRDHYWMNATFPAVHPLSSWLPISVWYLTWGINCILPTLSIHLLSVSVSNSYGSVVFVDVFHPSGVSSWSWYIYMTRADTRWKKNHIFYTVDITFQTLIQYYFIFNVWVNFLRCFPSVVSQ